MEENPSLKKKILSAIEEFCSPEEQAKVNALQPPVKSAGMIVYPDGNTFYWLEGYPNDFGDVKDKTVSFDRALMGTKPATLPSFVGKVYTEELYQYVDDKVRQNQGSKKSLEDMIKDSCVGWSNATFKFVGEAKTYTYYDFVQELEKRSEHKL